MILLVKIAFYLILLVFDKEPRLLYLTFRALFLLRLRGDGLTRYGFAVGCYRERSGAALRSGCDSLLQEGGGWASQVFTLYQVLQLLLLLKPSWFKRISHPVLFLHFLGFGQRFFMNIFNRRRFRTGCDRILIHEWLRLIIEDQLLPTGVGWLRPEKLLASVRDKAYLVVALLGGPGLGKQFFSWGNKLTYYLRFGFYGRERHGLAPFQDLLSWAPFKNITRLFECVLKLIRLLFKNWERYLCILSKNTIKLGLEYITHRHFHLIQRYQHPEAPVKPWCHPGRLQ